ncbi:MAG: hypothetical protein KAS16_03500 [Thermoplasmata archaeon]|nr:hypothetical protein [Thermoplasmata archaeon]
MTLNEKWLKNQVLKDTLNLFKVGCDDKNYKILLMVPTTIEEVQINLNLSTVKSAYTRVNALEDSGLVIRERGNGMVKPSPMTESFLDIIEHISTEVINAVPKYIE